MKFNEFNVEEICQEPGLTGLFKQIRIGGAICYKSEPKCSNHEFVERLINRGHLSVLEHGTIYLTINKIANIEPFSINNNYTSNNYYQRKVDDNNFYITTNYRYIKENGLEWYLRYMTDCTKHVKRHSFLISTQIAVTRELNRHRANSPSEQSTRYCNFIKDKFGSELSISIPQFIDRSCLEANKDKTLIELYAKTLTSNDPFDFWLFANKACEYSYLNMITHGAKTDEARSILPLDTETVALITSDELAWKHFLDLRCDSHAHLDAQVIANKIKEYLE